ncbi:HNH endonuclease [Fictibacillus aquaticus]|uniref:Putative HNH nuclease YajD n=1 Tax=Fictibacillus aquaticus TaxID=2021314 RepID=A0A235F981_9BACL|nr:HNH endonuclease signature motif containing protein [Fictibacillus aquaticus]OYD57880.1 HNH endonuclease [Fictibacillus aquaticus]
MVVKSKKPCSQPGCISLTRERFCDQHKQDAAKQYDLYQRDSVTTRFYKSMPWRKLRASALNRDNYLCQDCMKKKRLTPAEMVHHEVEVKEDWSRRLDITNLTSLCNSCHNKRHTEKGGSH